MFSYRGILYFAALPGLIGEKLRDMYLDPEVTVRCFTEGNKVAKEKYGDRIHLPGLAAPGISYIHLSAIGADMRFPEDDGEISVRPANFSSIDEAIERTEQPVDFAESEAVKWSRDYARRLSEVAGKRIGPTMGVEGPITTAALLYGSNFFGELLADREKGKRFLRAVTNSVIDFFRYLRGGSITVGSSHGIADDLSSLIGPSMWPEFVFPFWNQLYEAFTNDKRSLHCENLSEGHLPLLKEIGITSFDPDRAPALRPWMMKKHLHLPWRWCFADADLKSDLNAMRKSMEEAVECGASNLYLSVYDRSITREQVDFFFDTAEELGGKLA